VSVRARYRPSYGVLQPQQVLVVGVTPAIGAQEQPVLLSAENRAVIMKSDPDWVEIRNSGNAMTPYLLFVVPGAMVRAAYHPWSDIVQGLTASLQTDDGRRRLLRSLAAMIARSS